MDANLYPALSRLERGALLRLADGSGRTVAVFEGLVWITQDGDRRDVFLRGGESHSFDRPGLVLIEAIEPTRLVVLDAEVANEAIGYEAAWPRPAPVAAAAVRHAPAAFARSLAELRRQWSAASPGVERAPALDHAAG